MRNLFAIALAAALAAPPRSARAEDIIAYQADGDAAASAADARVEALDDAFGKAVAQAVSELVDPEVRRQSKAVIDRELIGHARLWVTRFTVSREAVVEDRKRVSVSVRIDRDRLRARLAELDIATRAVGDSPAPGAQSVTVLLRITTPEGVHASYGATADKDVAGLTALSGALRRANLAVKRAPAAGPIARPDGELPLDDETAEALAAETRAELIAVGGVSVGSPVPLRGVPASGVLVTARLRMIDRKAHRAIGQGAATLAALGADPGVVSYAIDRALLAAAADVLPGPAQSLAQAQTFTGDDRPITEPGVVLIRLARTTPWAMVQAELKHLLGARGVSRAALRHVSPAGWVIGVTTAESIDRIASIVKKPPTADTAVSVRIAGDLIEATLTGAP